MWMLIAFLCAAYVFVGLVPIVWAVSTGNWIDGGLALVAYGLNLWLLQCAKKKPW
jgi:Cu/Ag efflux pump CusA